MSSAASVRSIPVAERDARARHVAGIASGLSCAISQALSLSGAMLPAALGVVLLATVKLAH